MHHIKPLVIKPDGRKKAGKGFSPDEIQEAGLTVADTRKLRIPIDWRRKSCHDENIDSLKSHFENAPAAAEITKSKK